MRKTYRPKKQEEIKLEYQKNEGIKSPDIRLIDEKGVMIGVVDTIKALNEAREKGFDLVLVSPKANPPVAKFLDYGKFQYQQEKLLKKQKAKQKKVDTKCIRLSLRIGKHDKAIRVDQALKFLEKGHKVKFELTLKGREHQHTDLAEKNVLEVLEEIKQKTTIEIEIPINKQGSKITTLIYSKKS